MLNDLQNETNYLSECSFDVVDVVKSFNVLNTKYISEWCTYSSLKHHDFFVGTRILTHTFGLLMTSTMNLGLSSKVTTLALLYYIEFISQINLNRGRENAVLLGIINDAANVEARGSSTAPNGAGTFDTRNGGNGGIHENDGDVGLCVGGIARMGANVVGGGGGGGTLDARDGGTLDARDGTLDARDVSKRNIITYHDVMLFVYNKTLSNIVKHYVKSSRKLEGLMAECHYYFRLNTMMMRFIYNENSSFKNAGRVQTAYQKIINIIDSYLRYRLSCSQLQVVLIFVEYVMMTNADRYSKRIMVMFLIFPRVLLAYNSHMTADAALTRAASRQFGHRMTASTPYSFVRWFISRPEC